MSAKPLGIFTPQNPVFMAPMTRCRATNPECAPTDLHRTYYSQRAAAGLIITEGTVVSPRGTGYPGVPGLYSQSQVAGWKNVVDGVHEKGGSLENRGRFFFEILDALLTVVPVSKIGARLNPMLNGMQGIFVDDETQAMFDYIIDKLDSYSIAYLHLTRPFMAPLPQEPKFIADVIGHYRKRFTGFLVGNGNYSWAEAQNEIAAGRLDAVAFGRPFISNPDLPARFVNNIALAASNPETFYSPGALGYTDYKIYEKNN